MKKFDTFFYWRRFLDHSTVLDHCQLQLALLLAESTQTTSTYAISPPPSGL